MRTLKLELTFLGVKKIENFLKSTSDQKLFEQKPQFRLSDATQQRFVTGKKLNI